MSCSFLHECQNRSVRNIAAEHDLPEVLNLYRHLHPHDPHLETATAERIWSTLLTSSFMTVIVAQAAELLVFSYTLAIVPNLSRGGRSCGVIENVVTHSDYRRLELGRRVSCSCARCCLAGRLLQGPIGDGFEAGDHPTLL
jgi:hypothetical protein